MWSSKRLEGFFNYQEPDAVGLSSAAPFGETGLGPAPAPFGDTGLGPAPAPAPFGTGLGPAPAPFGDTGFGVAPAPVPFTNTGLGVAPAPFGTGLGPAPATVGSTNEMSVTLLVTLMQRIDDEQLRLRNLNSSDATIVAKINQLNLLRDEVADYKDQLNRNEIVARDIPMTVESANAFLQHLTTNAPGQGTYPSLFTNVTAVSAPAPATSLGSLGNFDFGSLQGAQGMFNYLQDMKWRFELSYDPTLSQKTDLLNRLEALEKRIMDYAKEGVAMPENVKQVISRELDLLTKILQNSKQTEAATYQPRQNSQHTRMTSSTSYRSDGRTYSNPSSAYMDSASIGSGTNSYSLFDGVPNDSPDVRVRPGFVLTDEQIRRRGSAAAFNDQAVGGPDYQKRATELCRQIRGANIGTPADFGCIENPAEVSANYSWKGNYKMVCSRLGDTWGSWYPAMFGCPATTPDDQYNGNLL